MKLAYNWISQYLPTAVPVDELSKILTSIGLEVEGVEKAEVIKGSLEGLVIGEVLTCEKHPNADKLSVTTVNVGNDTILPIVCGAPNVAAGQKVVVATVGCTVHPSEGESFLIKKSKIRGEASEGMICAEDEIGLGKSHAGIMVLPEDAPVGTLAATYFNVPQGDYVLEIGLTPNRSDANSHIGAARDVCAYLTHHNKQAYELVKPVVALPAKTADLPININIEATDACKQYLGITIANVTVTDSPEWLQSALKAIGVKPINNIVDITNYILNEYGQPLHAFDYDTLSGKTINVKNLEAGTKFMTLDGVERTLRAEDLMICDAEKALCIGGVYGGLHSGIKATTTNVFLESAYFDSKTIRRTSMHHGLRTDAATHFEKGVDLEMVRPALMRAAQLIAELGNGQIASDVIEVYPTPIPQAEIECKYEFINRLCGKAYDKNEIDVLLSALGFNITRLDENTFKALVPYNKVDVKQPADLVEEVLRIDGLDNVPMNEQISLSLNKRPEPTARAIKEKFASYLTANGMQEMVTNSITNSKYYPEHTNLVKMLNSLSVELDILRPELLESGLEVIAHNVNRKQSDLMVYENGNVYSSKGVGQYSQAPKLGIWITGNVVPQQWQHQAEKGNIYFLKGIVERLFAILGIQKFQMTVENDAIVWKRGKAILATVSQVTKAKLKAFDIKQDVFYAELDINNVVEAGQTAKVKFQEIPKFPAVTRDLALIIDKSITFDKVDKVINTSKLEAITKYELFDIFESEKIGADKKSVALSFTFQLKERTLMDEEVDAMMKTIITKAQADLGAMIRE